MSIRNSMYVALAFAVVTILWFVLGFLVPFLFNQWPENSGQFGDGFGSAAALFSGLSIVGLIYTIYLQVENAQNERRNKRFELVLKFVDDAKQDLINFTYSGKIGQHAIIEIVGSYYRRAISIIDQPSVVYLITIANTLNNTIGLTDKEFQGKEELDLIHDRIGIIYIRHFEHLKNALYTMYGGLMPSQISKKDRDVSHTLYEELSKLSETLFPGLITFLEGDH